MYIPKSNTYCTWTSLNIYKMKKNNAKLICVLPAQFSNNLRIISCLFEYLCLKLLHLKEIYNRPKVSDMRYKQKHFSWEIHSVSEVFHFHIVTLSYYIETRSLVIGSGSPASLRHFGRYSSFDTLGTYLKSHWICNITNIQQRDVTTGCHSELQM